MKYKLETIKGTNDLVKVELLEKHNDSEILTEKDTEIEFESREEDVDTFRDLYAPLRIEKENGLVRNLYRRDWKVETNPAGINPALAYVLCMIGKVNEEDTILDPFCGAGTIGITAVKYFNAKKVLMSDKSGKAVDQAIANSNASGVKRDKITIFRSNITMLKLQKESVSKIITNPPFGIRTGNHQENIKIYKELASKAQTLLGDDGRLIIFTQEKNLIQEIFSDFEELSSRQVSQGGLHPTIFVFRKK